MPDAKKIPVGRITMSIRVTEREYRLIDKVAAKQGVTVNKFIAVAAAKAAVDAAKGVAA